MKIKAKHAHDWNYVHTVWEGRTPNEFAVMRYCACGVRQCAFTDKWGSIPESYADMRNFDVKKD